MFFLYHGEDTYLSLSQAKRKLDELKEESNGISIVSIDADTTDSTTVISKISSTDMFSTKNIIFLKRVFKNKDKERLVETITNLLSEKSDIDVIFWEDHKVNGVTRYYKFFKKNNAVEEFAPMKQQSFIKWAKEELKKRELRAESDGIYSLASRSNFQTERFINEVEKLLLSGLNDLTVKLLEENTSDTIEFTIWKLMDAINAGDRKQSLSVLESLFNRNEDAHFILAMIARNIRLLVSTKDLSESGLRANEIASKLKVAPFAIYPLMDWAKKNTMTKLKYLYEKLASLDYEIKTGNIDPQLGLTLLVTKL